jgi:hypothetical protein
LPATITCISVTKQTLQQSAAEAWTADSTRAGQGEATARLTTLQSQPKHHVVVPTSDAVSHLTPGSGEMSTEAEAVYACISISAAPHSKLLVMHMFTHIQNVKAPHLVYLIQRQ